MNKNIFFPTMVFSCMFICQECLDNNRIKLDTNTVCFDFEKERFFPLKYKGYNFLAEEGFTPHIIQLKKESLIGSNIIYDCKNHKHIIEGIKTVTYSAICGIHDCGIFIKNEGDRYNFAIKKVKECTVSLDIWLNILDSKITVQ